MKKIKTSLFALLMLSAVSATLFSGCKKDKEEETVTPTPAPAPTKTELLTGKNWKVTAINCDPAIDWNGNGVMVTNIYAQLSPCGVDDITVFNTSGSYVLDAKVQCATEPATTTGTWIFNSAQTVITMDAGTANSTDFTILQLDASTLKGTQPMDLGTGVIYTLTVTYSKQ
ncbi:MAG: lipocalin family protein [Bacteroidetes bacterium]|mgnify:CR=1 FL=1|nr:lipocalin family protein [Bacteroidota bacterium]MBK9671379.1 lipocalin family protein [Bacteroidota bacterium]MBP6412202.1 lipocalin family protein [Bacteroidia bacterium]